MDNTHAAGSDRLTACNDDSGRSSAVNDGQLTGSHTVTLPPDDASRERIEAIAAEDPFVARGLADARIVEFRASQRAADIQRRVESDPGGRRG